MANFIEQTLSHEISGPYVMFINNVKIKLEGSEMGKTLRVQVSFMELDKFSPPDRFTNEHWVRTFVANKEIIPLEIHTPIQKEDINTEPGLEEVQAILKLVTADGQQVLAETKTNIIKVDV